jgi:hypothetical protein
VIEETKIDDSNLQISMVDVQEDQDFAITVDPSLINVTNMATGNDQLTLFNIENI